MTVCSARGSRQGGDREARVRCLPDFVNHGPDGGAHRTSSVADVTGLPRRAWNASIKSGKIVELKYRVDDEMSTQARATIRVFAIDEAINPQTKVGKGVLTVRQEAAGGRSRKEPTGGSGAGRVERAPPRRCSQPAVGPV